MIEFGFFLPKKNNEKHKGSYTNCYIYDDCIYKYLSPVGATERKLFNSLCEDKPVEVITDYYNQIIDAKIPAAQVVKLEVPKNDLYELCIVQKLIPGKTLEQWIVDNSSSIYEIDRTNINKSINLFAQVIDSQKKLWLHNQDLRIDLNTKNFIITHTPNNLNSDLGIILVDIIPPINIKKLPVFENRQENVLKNTYISLGGQAAALISYWIRPYIDYIKINYRESNIKELEEFYSKLLDVVYDSWKGQNTDVIDTIQLVNSNKCFDEDLLVYHNKLRQLNYYLNGKINFENFYKNFTSFSMRRFLDTIII